MNLNHILFIAHQPINYLLKAPNNSGNNETNWSLWLPHSRAFGDGFFELRPRGREGIGRAFYCFLVGKRVIVLHAFIKKPQQTPDSELKLARKRLKEVKHG